MLDEPSKMRQELFSRAEDPARFPSKSVAIDPDPGSRPGIEGLGRWKMFSWPPWN